MTVKDVACFVGATAAVVGGVYAVKMCKKIADISNSLDKTIKEVSEMTEVEIEDAMIEAAVERRVNVEVGKAVAAATTKIVSDLESDMRDDIKADVDKEKEFLQDSVKDKIEKEVKKINFDDLRRDVVKEAKEAAAKKFESDLDDVLEKYNENLEKVTKIYSNISASMNPKQTFSL